MNRKLFYPGFILLMIVLFFPVTAFAGEKKFQQTLSWQEDEAAFEYKVEIYSDDKSFSKSITTEESFVVLSLQSGKYRYRVTAYDFFGREASISDWTEFTILKAIKPVVKKVKEEVVADIKKDDEVKIPVNLDKVEEETTVTLVNVNTKEEVKGKLEEVETEDKGKELKAVFPKVDEGKWKLRVVNPGGLSDESKEVTVSLKDEEEELRNQKELIDEERRGEKERIKEERKRQQKRHEEELVKEQQKLEEECRLEKVRKNEEERIRIEIEKQKRAEAEKRAREASMRRDEEEKRKREEERLRKEEELRRQEEEKKRKEEEEQRILEEMLRLAKEEAERKRRLEEEERLAELKRIEEERLAEEKRLEEERLAREAEIKRLREEKGLDKITFTKPKAVGFKDKWLVEEENEDVIPDGMTEKEYAEYLKKKKREEIKKINSTPHESEKETDAEAEAEEDSVKVMGYEFSLKYTPMISISDNDIFFTAGNDSYYGNIAGINFANSVCADFTYYAPLTKKMYVGLGTGVQFIIIPDFTFTMDLFFSMKYELVKNSLWLKGKAGVAGCISLKSDEFLKIAGSVSIQFSPVRYLFMETGITMEMFFKDNINPYYLLPSAGVGFYF